VPDAGVLRFSDPDNPANDHDHHFVNNEVRFVQVPSEGGMMGRKGIDHADKTLLLRQKLCQCQIVGTRRFHAVMHRSVGNKGLDPAQEFGVSGVGVVEDLVLLFAIWRQKTGIEGKF